MYVCLCKSITDREIRSAVTLGARSLADVSEALGVATCCGRCADCARGVIDMACKDTAPAACGDD
jgi:bacterioferritin-associated ferredoxin